MLWEVEVLPLSHKRAIGTMPPVGVAVQLMLVVDGTPAQVTDKGVAAYATEDADNASIELIPSMSIRDFISRS